MLNIAQFRQVIIQPALKDMVMYSQAAEELLCFTCANESLGGTYLMQINGPALGVYQMEPETYNDIWVNFIFKTQNLPLIMVSKFDCATLPAPERLVWDLRFATAMTRLHYARVAEPLPDPSDINALWNYYKTYYNTSKGDALKYNALVKYRNFTGC